VGTLAISIGESTGINTMGTFLKLTGATILAIGFHLVASEAVLASVRPVSSSSASSEASVSTVHQPIPSLMLSSTDSSKSNPNRLKNETYQPPDDIGGPGDTQGSGTR
jgi:hypothetical protein